MSRSGWCRVSTSSHRLGGSRNHEGVALTPQVPRSDACEPGYGVRFGGEVSGGATTRSNRSGGNPSGSFRKGFARPTLASYLQAGYCCHPDGNSPEFGPSS